MHFKPQSQTIIVYKLTKGNKQPKFHFRMCGTLQSMVKNGRYDGRYVLATSRDGLFTVHAREERSGNSYKLDKRVKLYVCRNCLWQEDYDGYRTANKEQRTNIMENFNLGEFLDKEEVQHAH